MTRIGSLLAATLVLGGCAASALLSPRLGVPDAGTPQACVLPAAPTDGGAVLWAVGFSYPLAGPVAADSSGNTYFVGEGGGAGPGQITSIDACGSIRWQSFGAAVSGTGLGSATAFVSLDQLIVQTTEVEAFDLDQGTLRWSVDLVEFGVNASVLDDPTVLTNWIGPAAANSVGVIAVAMSSSKGISIVEIDSGGSPHLVGPPVLSSTDISDLIIDSTGNFELNTSLAIEQGTLVSLASSGQMRFSLPWPCLPRQGIGRLSSSGSFVVPQSELCAISLQGLPVFNNPLPSGPVVIDGDNNLYVGSLASTDATGATRWRVSAPSQDALLLGTEHVFGLATTNNPLDNGVASASVSTWSRSSGELIGSQSIPLQSIVATPGDNPFLPNIGVTLVWPGVIVVGGGNWAIGVSSAGEVLDPAAQWPTLRGGADERSAALGQ